MTIQKTALVRAVAAAAILCLSGAAAHAVEYNFSQQFTASGNANNITGLLKGTFEAGAVSGPAAPNPGLFENLTFLTLSFTGTYNNGSTNVPVNFSSTGPFNLPTAPGFNVFNPANNTLSEFGTGLAVSGTSGGLSINWVAGSANFFAPGLPFLFPQNGVDIFGNLSIFNGNTLLGSGDSNQWVATSPVPEVSTYLMMLAGIAGVAAAVRRRAV